MKNYQVALLVICVATTFGSAAAWSLEISELLEDAAEAAEAAAKAAKAATGVDAESLKRAMEQTKAGLDVVGATLQSAGSEAVEFAKENPTYAGCAVAGAVLAPVVVTLALPGVGFGAAGVGAGTLAAAGQSAIGNVVAGSLFAQLTSAGAAGMATTTIAGWSAAGAAVGVAGAVAHDKLNEPESNP